MEERRRPNGVWLEKYFQEASSDDDDDLDDDHSMCWGNSRAADRAAVYHHGLYARRWRIRRRCLKNRSCLKAVRSFGIAGTSASDRTNRSLDRPANAESFCDCPVSRLDVRYSSCSDGALASDTCKCGEEDTDFDWVWDSNLKLTSTTLNSEDREVKFHPEYSCGTAAVRGSQRMSGGQYYWEVKMTTPVYGTDMMIGVGTTQVDLLKYRYIFGSLLGSDCESWALSYTGNLFHKGVSQKYTSKFGQGNIIGIHLDMWHGTISFFKNRCALGVAYEGLQGKTLYPMVSSTSARSGMKVVRSRSFTSSLQFLCCRKLRQMVPSDESVLNSIDMPPGLKSYLSRNLDWLLCSRSPNGSRSKVDCDSKRFWTTEDDSSEDGPHGGDRDSNFSRGWKRFCLPLPLVHYAP